MLKIKNLKIILIFVAIWTQFLPGFAHAQIEDLEKFTCDYALPEYTKFSGRFLAASRKHFVAPGEIFLIQAYIQNTGTMPWFGARSGCDKGPIINLGTAKDQDRESSFFNNLSDVQSNWLGPNRILMTNERVGPYDIAVFDIWAKAPMEPGLYREFFSPVAENISWIESEAMFSVDIKVGEAQLDSDEKELLGYIQKSGNLTRIDLKGEKNIEIRLNEQKMHVKIGDMLVRILPVSTGAKKTPTPRGQYNILQKQEVRVASKKPHYVMPFFQMFKKGGFGLHALPSLANDRGIFWTEALNHIGRPVSHGCIRLLPKDAEFVWKFTDIGTKMVVRS